MGLRAVPGAAPQIRACPFTFGLQPLTPQPCLPSARGDLRLLAPRLPQVLAPCPAHGGLPTRTSPDKLKPEAASTQAAPPLPGPL